MKKFVSDWSIRKMFVVLGLYVFLSIVLPVIYLIFWSGSQIESKKAELDTYYKTEKSLKEIGSELYQAELYIRSWVVFSDDVYLMQLQQIWNNQLLKNIDKLASTTDAGGLDSEIQASCQVIINDLKNLYELHNKNGKISEKANGIFQPIPDAKEANQTMNATQVPLFQEINTITNQLVKSLEAKTNKVSDELDQIIQSQFLHVFWILLASIILNAGLFYLVFFRHISSSISNIIEYLSVSGKDTKKDMLAESQSELGTIAAFLNNIEVQNQEKLSLVESIIEGKQMDLSAHQSDSDLMYKALYELNKKLEDIAVQENKREWQNQAITRFADLFRSYAGAEKSVLADVFLKNISETLQANQAALYLLPDAEQGKQADYLQMSACYAWSRKKYLNSRFDLGEGMLGQCFLEKQSYYLENVPESFEFIKSGLGKGKPTCSLLCPVMAQESVLGVLEIASLYPIEPYKREFAQKMASDLSITLVALDTNTQTQLLLNDARQMSEQMSAQEEIMQQSMEELIATQEHAQRQIKEYELQINEYQLQIQELKDTQSVSVE